MAEAAKAIPKIVEAPEKQDGVFDSRTHIRDANTGRLIMHQPYSMHFQGEEKLMERPPGSGNMFADGGQPLGRYEWQTNGKHGHWKKVSDTHTVAPMGRKIVTAGEAAQELSDENAQLKAELLALQAERDELFRENQDLAEQVDTKE